MSISIDGSSGINQSGVAGASILPTGTDAQRPASPGDGMMRYNTERGHIEYYDQSRDEWLPTSIISGSLRSSDRVTATGGTTADIMIRGTPYRVHAFTNVGNSTFNVTNGGNVDVLIVGGGGPGGPKQNDGNQDTGAGGGGAGGVVFKLDHAITSGSYTITVGDGGLATQDAQGARPPNGDDSSAFGVTAKGGGHGNGSDEMFEPGDGGCGGGAGGRNDSTPTNEGGVSTQDAPNGWVALGSSGESTLIDANVGGGGGGGATQAGHRAELDINDSRGGNGGAGFDAGPIFGRSFGQNGYFAGGGGGGGYTRLSLEDLPQSHGGLGGGGRGVAAEEGVNLFRDDDKDAMPNTGGGGGGSGESNGASDPGSIAGSGGSGIVLIRYQL